MIDIYSILKALLYSLMVWLVMFVIAMTVKYLFSLASIELDVNVILSFVFVLYLAMLFYFGGD